MTDPCPNDVKQRGEILNWNGFNGFQAPDGCGKDCFVVCFFSDQSLINTIDEIKEETQCQSLTADDWIGRDYLRVHWRDHSRIPIVLNTLLKRGHNFQSATKGLPFFDHKKDTVFSLAVLEKKVIAQVNYLMEHRLIDMIDDAYCEAWNYVTEEGKVFARALKANPLMCHYDNSRTNFYEWPIFKDYDIATLMSK